MALATERKRRKFKEIYIYRDQNSLAGSIGVVWLRSPTRDFPPSAKKAGQGGLSITVIPCYGLCGRPPGEWGRRGRVSGLSKGDFIIERPPART